MLSAKKDIMAKNTMGDLGRRCCMNMNIWTYEQTDTLCIGANEKKDVNELNQYTIWWKADAIFGIYVNV